MNMYYVFSFSTDRPTDRPADQPTDRPTADINFRQSSKFCNVPLKLCTKNDLSSSGIILRQFLLVCNDSFKTPNQVRLSNLSI